MLSTFENESVEAVRRLNFCFDGTVQEQAYDAEWSSFQPQEVMMTRQAGSGLQTLIRGGAFYRGGYSRNVYVLVTEGHAIRLFETFKAFAEAEAV